ncbi:autotransporter outer membrane beta-barrel domain-containing protein [Oxalicibacterium flavum]|uniref:autotransporter outer membrane beta-barrel domain-containing protein n=1 Tax=Oxalicibacterium flavum TaxID=179467 RepID=UPI00166DFCD3|nr:autotransporter outer membrane beta-barrel domain-containing protein [Oxalicibacterium flavum]
MLRRTAITAALLTAYGYAPHATAVDLVIDNEYDLGTSNMSNSTVIVNNGGIATGDGTRISGSATEVVLINAGGQLTLDNAQLSNNLDHPTGRNGRVIHAKGTGASATLNNATIDISAQSTNSGADYNHAFTAGVGASNGGQVELNGGSINASGSKRTVGMQAIDGGSIHASDVTITTNNHFGHAVNVFQTPSSSVTETRIDLERVVITTNADSYAVGIQSANKGAIVTAVDTDIITRGDISFGVESFNGAEIALTDGSITTTGLGAAGVRVYGGALGNGSVSVDGTRVTTSGDYASGVLAGDAAEPTSGTALINGAIIDTAGANAAGIESAYGSNVDSTASDIHTAGDSAHGVHAHDGGSVTLDGDTVTTDGLRSYGLYATDAGSRIDASNASVTTNGLHGYGARAENGGAITLDGGSITTSNPKGRGTQDGDGSRAYALTADGAGSSIAANGTTIVTEGQRAYGAYATNGGHVTLDGGSIATKGFMAYGVYASGAGSQIDANDVAISTSGNVGDGAWAYQGGVLNLNGGSITVGGEPNANTPHETANGLVAVGGDGSHADGTINADGVTVVTTGSDSNGILAGATVGSAYTSGTVNLKNSSVTVHGTNAVAANVSYGSTLSAEGSTLKSVQGDGIVMEDNATVTLNGTSVEAAGASLVSNLNRAGQQQDITVGAGSTLLVNNGTLLQVNRSEDSMDGIVNLTLQAGSVSRGDVVDLDGLSESNPTRSAGGKTNFTVGAGAQWSGIVRGINDAAVEDGGSFIDNGGAPIAGNVSGGTNSTIDFNNGAQIGGDVATYSGSEATFRGTTSIGGSVRSEGSDYRFEGTTTIGQSLQASDGSRVVFAGPTTIAADVSASASSLSFSQTAPTTIGGDLVLEQGASLGGGSVATPITIEGAAVANSGAILGGNLVVQGALSGNGGTLSPGNSIGTQSYASSAGFSGSYKAEVNAAGQSDLIVFQNGNVDLSGIALQVAQENGNGGYRLNHDYTILQTVNGEVENTFASQALDDSFAGTLVTLDPVKYGDKDVKISLSVDDAKVDAARDGFSRNQNATLDGVLSVAGRNRAADAALLSADSGNAMNQLSGELHASTSAALFGAGEALANALSHRLRDSLDTQPVRGVALAQASGSVSPAALPASGTPPIWAQVLGNWQTLDGDGNAARVKSRHGGLLLGGDTAFANRWRVGAAVAVTEGRIDVDSTSSGSNVRSYSAALYGGTSWNAAHGDIKLLVGGSYTRHDLDSQRSVTLGGDQTLEASYHSNALQLFGELAYALPTGIDSTVEPYVGIAWNRLRSNAYTETGGPAALQGESSTDDVHSVTLGVRGRTAIDFGAQRAWLGAGLGWRHAGGDLIAQRRMAFIEGNGSTFDIAGTPIAEDAAIVHLSAEIAAGINTALGISYNGQFGDGNRDQGASVYFRKRF